MSIGAIPQFNNFSSFDQPEKELSVVQKFSKQMEELQQTEKFFALRLFQDANMDLDKRLPEMNKQEIKALIPELAELLTLIHSQNFPQNKIFLFLAERHPDLYRQLWEEMMTHVNLNDFKNRIVESINDLSHSQDPPSFYITRSISSERQKISQEFYRRLIDEINTIEKLGRDQDPRAWGRAFSLLFNRGKHQGPSSSSEAEMVACYEVMKKMKTCRNDFLSPLKVVHDLQGERKDEEKMSFLAEQKESIIPTIKDASEKDKMALVEIAILHGQADLILNNVFYLDLLDGQIDEVLLYVAMHDPEALLYNFENLRLIDHPLGKDLYRELLLQLPEETSRHLVVVPYDKFHMLSELIDQKPEVVLQNYRDLLTGVARAKLSKEKLAKLDDLLIKRLREKYENNSVAVINELMDVETGSAQVDDFLSHLRRYAIKVPASELFEFIVQEQLQCNDPTVPIELPEKIIEFLRKKGYERNWQDLVAYAVVFDEKDRMMMVKIPGDDEPSLENLSLRWWIKGMFSPGIAYHKYEFYPIHPDTKREVLNYFMENNDSELAPAFYYYTNEDFLGAEKNVIRGQDKDFYAEVLKFLYNNPELSNHDENFHLIVDSLSDGLNLPNIQKLVDRLIIEHPDFLHERVVKDLNPRLNDKQRVLVVEAFIKINPYFLADLYPCLIFDNGKTEIEMIRKLMNQGVEPFSLFENVGEALKFLHQKNTGNLWKGNLLVEERKKLIDKWRWIRKTVSHETWDYLQKLEYRSKYDFNILDLPEEGLRALDQVVQKHPEWLKSFETLQDPRPSKILYLFMNTTPHNYQFVGRLAKEYEQLKLKPPISPNWKRKRKTDRPEREMPYELTGIDRFLYLSLAGVLNISVAEIMDFVSKNITETFDERRRSDDEVLEFLLWDNNFHGRWSFLCRYQKQIQLFQIKYRSLLEPSHQYDSRAPFLLEKIFILPSDERKNFFEADLDMEAISKGFDQAQVFHFLLSMATEAHVSFKDKENLDLLISYMREFGLWNDPIMFNEYRRLKNGGEASLPMIALGVKNISAPENETSAEAIRRGNQILNSFRVVMRRLRDKFILGGGKEFSPEMLSNPIVINLIKYFSDYEVSEWSRSKSMERFIAEFQRDQQGGLISPLDTRYLKNIEATKFEDQNWLLAVKEKVAEDSINQDGEKIIFQLSNEAKQRYNVLAQSWRQLIEIMQDYPDIEPQEIIREQCLTLFNQEIERLQLARQKMENENEDLPSDKLIKRLAMMQANIDKLIMGRAMVEQSEDLLSALIDYEIKFGIRKENPLSSEMIRRLTYLKAFRVDSTFERKIKDCLELSEPTIKTLPTLIELFNNRFQQHILPYLVQNMEAQKRLQAIFSMEQFSADIRRINTVETGKKKSFSCVPSRGVLAELSGYYCDACWTSQNFIMRENPNMMAYAFISNPEDSVSRKIAGGTLIMETTISGEKTLIIRGFNPKQNVLATVNAGDFLEQFIDEVLVPVAQRLGVTKIVAPVLNKQALSNRPEINEHFDQKYRKANRVKLDKEVAFNGYNITNACVVVRELGGIRD